MSKSKTVLRLADGVRGDGRVARAAAVLALVCLGAGSPVLAEGPAASVADSDPAASQTLIPATASLRPPGEATAVAAPVVPDEPPAPAVDVAAATTVAEGQAAAPAIETTQRPDEASVLPSLSLPDLGQLAIILPVIGAVLLAVTVLALMRGRQAAPPAVFAGRDPWDRLARETRADG